MCCDDSWIIPTGPPTPPVDIDVKLDPAGEEFFANNPPFKCTVCDTLHAGPDPPESVRCCPSFWVVGMGEVDIGVLHGAD
jgi:hypothetical protein